MKKFRSIIRQTISVVAFLFSILAFSQEAIPSLKGKNIIYIYGGLEGHSPKESVDFFVPKLKAEGANVKVFDNLKVYTDEKIMNETDLIIQIFTLEKISNEEFKGLERAIFNGTGLAGWHGGLGDAFRDNLKYQFIVGGQFVSHPGGRIDHNIRVINNNDPITKGVDDFDLKKTEQYYMLVDPNVKVLAVSEFEKDRYERPGKKENKVTGSVMPVVWKKNYGKGRVFYSSIGHFLTDFDVPEVLKIQMRGFRWASEGKYHQQENLIFPIYGNEENYLEK